jgi:hypothetical protein
VTTQFDARDNRQVARVELYVDGKLTGSSTTAPFTIKFQTRKLSSGTHTLTAKAYDAAGNIATSAGVGVTK